MGPPWKFVGYVERELDEGRPGRKLWSFEHGAFDAADMGVGRRPSAERSGQGDKRQDP
jgi:hypothetical protein